MTIKTMFLAFGVLIILVFLAGCAAPTPAATPTLAPTSTPTSAPTISCAGFPYGTYSNEDGSWMAQLNSNCSYRFSSLVGGVMDLIAEGTFSNAGSEVTWVDSTYCNGTFEPATYTWTNQNGTLVFSLKGTDLCVDRNRTIDGVPFHK
jgi:hypothetical protein